MALLFVVSCYGCSATDDILHFRIYTMVLLVKLQLQSCNGRVLTVCLSCLLLLFKHLHVDLLMSLWKGLMIENPMDVGDEVFCVHDLPSKTLFRSLKPAKKTLFRLSQHTSQVKNVWALESTYNITLTE